MTEPGDSEPVLQGLPTSADAGLQARDTLEVLLSQFADEVRAGRFPSIEDYVQRHPHLADEIRELFPLVFSLESWKSNKEVECLRRTVPRDFSVDRIGEYRVVRELGRGGMGIVFEAILPKAQRPVAIKLLPWRFANDMQRWKDRFYQEASTIAALRHKNIVPVHSFGCHDGYYYYVMQYIEGIGLNQVIDALRKSSRPVDLSALVARSTRTAASAGAQSHSLFLSRDSWRAFARLAEQIADALVHAHQQNVLHNDIKPSNLLVKANGQVIVTDFGIGRWAGPDEAPLDGSTEGVGTLRYAAPERLAGTADPSSDVYSLGVTLYELATQSVPFESINQKELLSRVLSEELPPARKLTPSLPVPLETLLLTATARQPQDRYGSAAALAEDLRRFQRGETLRARRKSLLQKTVAWYQSLRRPAGGRPT